MEKIKLEPYLLYQTLQCNIPKRKLTDEENEHIQRGVTDLTVEQKIAFFRLILEYARLEEENDYRSIESLPYGGLEIGGEAIFDIDLLPQSLMWILFRFIKVCEALE